MKKALIVLVGLMAVSAYAVELDVFFSTDNNIELKTPGAIDLGNKGAGDTQTIYLYAQVDLYNGGTWNGFGVSYDISSGGLSNGQLYNPNCGTGNRHQVAGRRVPLAERRHRRSVHPAGRSDSSEGPH